MSPASRVAGEGLSPIRRMSVGAPPDAVNLGLGEPGWTAWSDSTCGPAGAPRLPAPHATDLSYGLNTSDPALVAAIARYAAPPGQGVVGPEQVMVTSGSQAALFALFQAHVDPGTSVLVPDPGFVAYATLARLCGATPVGYPLTADGDLDGEALVRVLDEQRHTSLAVLNHPANPTGGLASPRELRAVASACSERGVLLVSDEVYAELWLDAPVTSVHDVVGVEQAVVLGSMSKAFAAPGLRIGWAVGAEDVLAPARLVHNAMTTAPARPSQAAALALLKASDEVLPAARDEIRLRWACVERLAPHLLGRHGQRALGDEPQSATSRRAGRAGFYLWLPVPAEVGGTSARTEPGVGGPGRSDADDAEADATLAFALRLRDEVGVTTIPGTAFGPRGAGFLRVSVGGPVDQLEEGLRRLAPWWKA